MENHLPKWNPGSLGKQYKEDSEHGTMINICIPTKSAIHLQILECKRLQSCLPPEARVLGC